MNRTQKTLPATLLVALGLVFSGPALAQPLPEVEGEIAPPEEPPEEEAIDLQGAIELYRNIKYTECAAAFAELLGEKRIPDAEVQRARYYHIACLIGANKLGSADEEIRKAVRQNPQLFPDRREFPRPVIDRFTLVRNQMIQEIEKAQQERIKKAQEAAERERKRREAQQRRLEKLRELASRETVVRKNSRWVAAVPFGVGQFQNRDAALGYTFLTVEALALAGWLTAVTAELTLIAQADENKDQAVLSDRLDSWRTVNTVTGWSFLAIAGLGILEAQLSFEPQFKSTRRRKLPDDLLADEPPAEATPPTSFVRPLAAPVAGGAQVGVFGTF